MTDTRLAVAAPGRWCLTGVLDFDSVPRLASAATRLWREASRQRLEGIEIDLSAVAAANSAGLALLLEWLEVARARNIALTFSHLPDSLHRIARVSNIEHLLPVTSSAA